MRQLTNPTLTAALFGIFSLFVPTLEAFSQDCQCPGPVKGTKDSFQQADLVFVGSIEKYQKSALRPGYNEAQVRLMSRLKGMDDLKGSSLYLYTPEEATKCGIKFLVGQDYIIYAEGNLARPTATSCTRTGILDNALDEMEELQKLAGKR